MTNKRNTRTFEFELSDAPVLMHAMSIAASTAMMCGHPKAKQRLQQFRDFFKQLIPVEVNRFNEEVWCEIGMALAQAKTCHVTITQRRWHRVEEFYSEGAITVAIDGKWWQEESFKLTPANDPAIEGIHNVLSELAPVSCVCTFDPDPASYRRHCEKQREAASK